jgi:hypothetical protein
MCYYIIIEGAGLAAHEGNKFIHFRITKTDTRMAVYYLLTTLRASHDGINLRHYLTSIILEWMHILCEDM